MGSADLACASLTALCDAHFIELAAVVTQPDKPRGRDLKLVPSEVKNLALSKSLPVLQPVKARDPHFIDQLRELRPELIVVTAYGQILSKAILELPTFGCLNVHTSLLPRHRGAAPIQWAILEGDSETGVTIMKMDQGLDTGDILSISRTPIAPSDNSQTLHDRLAIMGAELLIQTVPLWVSGELKPQPQLSEGSTYARKISKEDGLILWNQPASVISNKVRAFTPWPGAFTFIQTHDVRKMLKIWVATPLEEKGEAGKVVSVSGDGILIGCGESSLRVTELQKEGGRRMKSREFLAGNKMEIGQLLG
ncbi:MAG: Methionyl-tRNA formyltransferase [Verrucomicrobiales bacterium]|nr:Methionyl-tRNA formyltransferase [Verrucomicrobiales bacterium]